MRLLATYDISGRKWLYAMLLGGIVVTIYFAVSLHLLQSEIALVPSWIDIGTAPAGQEQVLECTVVNSTDVQIEILGSTSSCNLERCIVVMNCPKFIAPMSQCKLQVHVAVYRPGSHEFEVVLFTTSLTNPRLTLVLAGQFVGQA